MFIKIPFPPIQNTNSVAPLCLSSVIITNIFFLFVVQLPSFGGVGGGSVL